MKRRDLLKTLRDWATASDAEMVVTEGSSHTKVKIGDRQTVVPRHHEINEITAKHILKQMGVQ